MLYALTAPAASNFFERGGGGSDPAGGRAEKVAVEVETEAEVEEEERDGMTVVAVIPATEDDAPAGPRSVGKTAGPPLVPVDGEETIVNEAREDNNGGTDADAVKGAIIFGAAEKDAVRRPLSEVADVSAVVGKENDETWTVAPVDVAAAVFDPLVSLVFFSSGISCCVEPSPRTLGRGAYAVPSVVWSGVPTGA